MLMLYVVTDTQKKEERPSEFMMSDLAKLFIVINRWILRYLKLSTVVRNFCLSKQGIFCRSWEKKLLYLDIHWDMKCQKQIDSDLISLSIEAMFLQIKLIMGIALLF